MLFPTTLALALATHADPDTQSPRGEVTVGMTRAAVERVTGQQCVHALFSRSPAGVSLTAVYPGGVWVDYGPDGRVRKVEKR